MEIISRATEGENGNDDQFQENLMMIKSYGDGISWRRGRLLGEGSFGSVFVATLKDGSWSYVNNSVMAVKSAQVFNSDTLKHEREVLSSLVGCPNIIQCFGDEITYGIEGSMVYNLLLEYGSGGTLSDRIYQSCDKGLPEYEVRCYTRSILKGLIKIHQVGYVHCDLKPENVLLVPRNRNGSTSTEFMAKICDFGLAKRVKQFRQKGRKIKRSWMGTPMFLSPEAARDCVQETPSDIWALGCVVLEMLTGHSPWDVQEGQPNTEENILRKLVKGVAVPKIPKQLSHDAKSFLNCCLKRMVKNRATAKTLLYHPFVRVNNADCDYDNDSKNINGVAQEQVEDMINNGLKSSGSDQHSVSHSFQQRRYCHGRSSSSQIRPMNGNFQFV